MDDGIFNFCPFDPRRSNFNYIGVLMSRGIVNNNPFNIRRSSSAWLGKIPFSQSTDVEFEQFKVMKYGLRAGIILLRNYIRKGYDTPWRIIRRFAPPIENNTSAYIAFISRHGVSPYIRISFGSNEFYKLCRLICRYESDFDIDISTLQEIVFKFKIKS